MPPFAAPLIGGGLIAKEYRTTRTNLTLDFRKIPGESSSLDLNVRWVEL
jgi:hypothetical protein